MAVLEAQKSKEKAATAEAGAMNGAGVGAGAGADDGAAPLVEPMEQQEELFEGLMRQVGQKGPFQTRFNYLFNLVFTVLISMPYLNIVMAMSVPDHWCHVPGRQGTNYSEKEWKELTIPREGDGWSQCTMYNLSALVDVSGFEALNHSSLNDSAGVVGCQHGWEYDHTWYTLTAPSQEDWVCDRSIYVSNVFAFSRAGDVIGSFIFGQLGDSIGRRPIFFITLMLLLLGRGLSVVTAAVFPLFLITAVVGSTPSSAAFQSPFTIGMEISASDKRGHIAMLQCLGWTLGICLVPLLAWVCPHWVPFMLITTLPCAVFLFLQKFIPESPRWLASRGRTGRCREVLEHIAGVNGKTLPPETDAVLRRLAGQREKVFGVASLFASRRLAFLSALICYSWFVNSVTYYTLMLHVSWLAGNPFLNYLWQSLVELPAYIVGQWVSDRYGRRWTQSGFFFVLSLTYLALVGTVADPNMSSMTTCLVVFAKFCVTISFYVIYLQCMEIYPTCVRQTGTALASLVGSGLGILGPYILYLGETDVRYPHAMMCVLAITGAAACSFLPETLHQQLPETLVDAHRFGRDQQYWQFNYNPKRKTDEPNSSEEKPLAKKEIIS